MVNVACVTTESWTFSLLFQTKQNIVCWQLSTVFIQSDHLLCHDDKCEDRRIAFILYLSEHWLPDYGGSLELFNTDGKFLKHYTYLLKYKAPIYVSFPKCSGKHYADPSFLYTGSIVPHTGPCISNFEFLLLLTKYYPGHQIKYGDMNRACSMYGRSGTCRVLVGKPE